MTDQVQPIRFYVLQKGDVPCFEWLEKYLEKESQNFLPLGYQMVLCDKPRNAHVILHVRERKIVAWRFDLKRPIIAALPVDVAYLLAGAVVKLLYLFSAHRPKDKQWISNLCTQIITYYLDQDLEYQFRYLRALADACFYRVCMFQISDDYDKEVNQCVIDAASQAAAFYQKLFNLRKNTPQDKRLYATRMAFLLATEAFHYCYSFFDSDKVQAHCDLQVAIYLQEEAVLWEKKATKFPAKYPIEAWKRLKGKYISLNRLYGYAMEDESDDPISVKYYQMQSDRISKKVKHIEKKIEREGLS